MDYSADSLRYLHIAYTIFIVVQVAYVAWLVLRWKRVNAAAQDTRNTTR